MPASRCLIVMVRDQASLCPDITSFAPLSPALRLLHRVPNYCPRLVHFIVRPRGRSDDPLRTFIQVSYLPTQYPNYFIISSYTYIYFLFLRSSFEGYKYFNLTYCKKYYPRTNMVHWYFYKQHKDTYLHTSSRYITKKNYQLPFHFSYSPCK